MTVKRDIRTDQLNGSTRHHRCDPFEVASRGPTLETLHGCIDGWVYLGFEGEDSEANDEHVEEIERVPCRRCNAEKL